MRPARPPPRADRHGTVTSLVTVAAAAGEAPDSLARHWRVGTVTVACRRCRAGGRQRAVKVTVPVWPEQELTLTVTLSEAEPPGPVQLRV